MCGFSGLACGSALDPLWGMPCRLLLRSGLGPMLESILLRGTNIAEMYFINIIISGDLD